MFAVSPHSVRGDDAEKPNVLFIAMDDLNDWIGCMGGHPQTLTPNLDRLAKSGVLFTNAHCPGAACNSSRTAIMTGLSPHRSGLYDNGQKMREVLPDAEILPQHFRNHGYRSVGSGKMLHYFIDAHSWDEYNPKKETENPFPPTFYPEKRPVSLPRGGPWQYVETDWAALDVTDEEFGGDWLVSKWVGEQLAKTHDKPLFLACGIYRPHEPWFVPKKYFEPFPLDEIQLPPGYREGDLDDLPESGKKAGPNRYFAHIRKQGQWKQGIQGYLASVYFADAMLGRVLDALENGPNADNTIVVLWSDHGWHLGEKQHWQKYTGWRRVTRIPLMVRIPENCAPGLMSGTKAGTVCDRPVNLLSLFPTLNELAGIAQKEEHDGPSLVPLLKDSDTEWPHVSLTHLSRPGSYGMSADDWRYIHYSNGDEELYQIKNDPHEWTNLANNPKHAAKLAEMRSKAPETFAPLKEASLAALPELKWHSIRNRTAPASKPDGSPFPVTFINRRDEPVELFWMTLDGKRKSYGVIPAGKKKSQQTRPGAVWQIAEPKSGEPLGHFIVDDRKAKAIVPKAAKSAATQKTPLPNIVIIYADDLGHGDLSSYNPKAAYKTPRLDQLAAEGIKFVDAHSPSTICSPSRYGLFSGQLVCRTGRRSTAFEGPGGPSYLAPGQLAIAEMLKEQGYRTGVFGKWHLGLTWYDEDGKQLGGGFKNALLIDYEKSTPLVDGPNNRGFDESFVTPNCPTTDPLYLYIENGMVPVPADHRYKRDSVPNLGGKWRWDNDEGWAAPGYQFVDADLLFYKKTVDFIKQHRKTTPDKPFFAVLSTQISHAPVLPAEEFRGVTKAGPRGDFVRELDTLTGRLLDKLEELGIDENTLVIFNSDNGPETVHTVWMRTDHKHDAANGYRGMKRDGWEGGHRVPMIVRWPGHVPAGRVSSQLINTTDIFATLASLTGYELAENDAVDSFDMLPALLGTQPDDEPIRPHMLTQSFRSEFQLRQGNWKYLDHTGSGGNNYDNVNMKPYALPETAPDATGQLYDLSNDPGETTNLFFIEADKRKKMQALLKQLTQPKNGRSAPRKRRPVGIVN